MYNGVISLASVYTRTTSGSRRSVLLWQVEGSGVGEPRKMGCDIYCYDRDNRCEEIGSDGVNDLWMAIRGIYDRKPRVIVMIQQLRRWEQDKDGWERGSGGHYKESTKEPRAIWSIGCVYIR